MSTYRNYIRVSPGFDGITAESEAVTNYEKVGNYVYETQNTSVVGRFSPISVGRSNVVSLARIMLQGTIDPMTDFVAVIDSSGQTRFTAPASLISSGFLFLGPQDTIKIFAEDCTIADILIQDLDDQTLQEYITAIVESGNTPVTFPITEIIITTTANVPAYNGHLVIFIENPADAILTLPELADLDNGSQITFIKRSGAGLASVRVFDGASDQVNGQVGLTATEYFFRSFADSITYTKLTDGYQLKFGEQATEQYVPLVAPFVIPNVTGGTLFVNDAIVGAGTLGTLPTLANTKQGVSIVYRNSDTLVHRIAAADGVNGAAQILVPAGGTMTFQAGEDEWIGTGADAFPINTQSVGADATLNLVGGHLYVRVNAGADITITLPSTTANTHKLGSQLTIYRAAGAGTPRIIIANALDTVNGVAGIVPTEYFLRSIGDCVKYDAIDGGWTRDFGEQVGDQVNVAAAPFVIAPFTGGTLFVEDTSAGAGNLGTLPTLATTKQGVRIVYRNADTLVHRIAAADNINGAAQMLVPAAGTMVFEAGETEWIATGADAWVQQLQTINAAGAINATAGELIVNCNLGADGDITLPSTGTNTYKLGQRILIYRSAGAGVPRIIIQDPLDTVNGIAGVVATEYYLRSTGDSITYVATPGGWVRHFGEQAPKAFAAATNPIAPPAFTGGTQYVFDAGTVLDNQCTLPLTSACKFGVRYLVHNYDVLRHQVVPSGGDVINNAVRWYVQPGETAMFEVASPTNWFAIGGGTQNVPVVTAADTVLTPFIGEFIIETTGGAGQSVTLPVIGAGIAAGTKVYMYNSSINLHSIVAGAGNTIYGAPSQAIATTTGFVAYCDGSTDWKGWTIPA